MPRKELTTVATEPTGEDRTIQVETTLPVRPRRHESGKRGRPDSTSDAGTPSGIPRITRLMALAIKFQHMVDRGEVKDYADLARLGYVTRARMTQIMNMVNLAPDIQEELLFPPEGTVTTERLFRQIITVVDWNEQRRRWERLRTPANQKLTMSPESGTRRATKMP